VAVGVAADDAGGRQPSAAKAIAPSRRRGVLLAPCTPLESCIEGAFMRGHRSRLATAIAFLVLGITAPAGAQAPDLQVTALSAPPAAIAAGGVFSITDTTSNTGAVPIAVSTVTRYRLSLDPTITRTDLLLSGTHSVPALAAGAHSTATVKLTVPAATAAGVYFVAACADDAAKVTESSETNNCRAASATLRVTRPDLVVTSVSDPPSTAYTGGTMSVTDTTANSGDGSARSSATRFRLSADATITTGDTLLSGSHAVPALQPGARSTATTTVTIPSGMPEGAYHLAACADTGGRVAESDETNNCRASSARVVVKRPADLVIDAVSNPPPAVVTGGAFTVTDTTDNNGPGAAAPSITRYRLSLNSTIEATDPLLTGTRAVPALASGARSTGTVAVTVPVSTPAGTYSLAACADDTAQVVEKNETNNCRRASTVVVVAAPPAIGEISPASGATGTPVTITGASFGASQGSSRVTFNSIAATPTTWSATRIVAPVPAGASTGPVVVRVAGVDSNAVTFTVLADLRVTSLANPPAAAVAGGTFSVTDTTAAAGGAVRATVTRYRLSSDGTITAADPLLIGVRAVERLAAGAASSGSVTVTIPGSIAPGRYVLGACADDTALVVEASETNNCLAAATTVTVAPAPVIAALSASGGAVGTMVTISGSGFGASASGGTVAFGGTTASPTSWSATAIVVAVPAGAATGPVTVTVGGVGSNGLPFTVAGSPDLRVISLAAPPAASSPGAAFLVGETTANVGTAPAAASVTRYRLSPDPTIDPGDVVLAETRTVPALAPGETSSGAVTLTIPPGLAPGRYYLAACADAGQAVAESSETNNCRLAGTVAQVTSARDRGLAWLITHQAGDGSWSTAIGARIVATSAALEALAAAGLRGYPYGRGVAWLSNVSALGVDTLARQIGALAQAGADAGPHAARLLGWRNGQGAWGAYEGFETTFPDTALALRALRRSPAAFGDDDVRRAFCAGPLPAQRPDGSWSYSGAGGAPPGAAGTGAVVPTAYTLVELDAVARARGWTGVTCGTTTYLLSAAIDSGLGWLLTQRRKSDGGFSDGTTSTVLDTAIVHQALGAVAPAHPAVAGALDFLLAAQHGNGSWGDDALATALAVATLPPATAGDTDRDGVPDTVEVLLGTGVASSDSRWLAQTANTPGSVADAAAASTLALVSVVPPSIPADETATARITVRLSRGGVGVAGQPVTLTTTAGQFAGRGMSTTVMTGADGQAIADLRSIASKAGVTAAVTASYLARLSASATVGFTGVGVPEVGYLSGTAGDRLVRLDWSLPAGAPNVVIVRTTGSAPTGVPVDGIAYGVGDAVSDGRVVYTGAATAFTDLAVVNDVDYVYGVFARQGSTPLYSAGTRLRLRPSSGGPGEPIWSFALAGAAMSTAPIPGADGLLYQVARPGLLAGVAAATGVQVFAPVAGDPAGLGSVSPPALGGGRRVLVMADGAGRVQAIDAASAGRVWGPVPLPGAEAIEAPVAIQAWEASDSAFRLRFGPAPTDVAFVVTRNASTTANRIHAVRVADGAVLWQFNELGAHALDGMVAAPVVDHARNRLYVASRGGVTGAQSTFWALDTLSGALVAALALGDLATTPLIGGGGTTAYAVTAAGHLHAIDLTSAPPARKWTGPAALGSAPAGPPREDRASPGRLYVSTRDGFVWSLQDPGSGGSPPDVLAPAWKAAVSGPSAPLVTDASVVVGSIDGRLRELRLADGFALAETIVGDGLQAVGPLAAGDSTAVYVGTTGEHLYRYQVPLP
jgi:subtilase family serine protease